MSKVIIDWYPTSIEASYKKMRYSQYGKVAYRLSKDLAGLEGRPRLATGLGYYVVCDEIHQWFLEIDKGYRDRVNLQKLWVNDATKYSQNNDRCAFVLDFKEPSLAMMFRVMFGSEPKAP